ncbi:hypothetical protein [Clostridium beijerinckii]|uniref:Uncharacterized protein n=1 Tax=Clostridium beijerinckii TaxID=1520 RepID=A0A0B5QTV0_CLOBE|nr:hypothetical protein [Clostridium beijerinckii]AJH00294.1 hypothetical protein LF65_03739 [Clostridium beijerinckii]MBA8934202.1 hypothetical protein [Clostridium beijerinckii]NRT35885.1 hypothetical protein [Clostridium beijerinckii]NRT44688.1 hypothetical protein [Clostridium beijerinckii]NRT80478.1 hypothetical protein [Clostridium beijerinckii]
MKAYKCSKCTQLYYLDERFNRSIGIDARTNHIEKGDTELSKKNFKQIKSNGMKSLVRNS